LPARSCSTASCLRAMCRRSSEEWNSCHAALGAGTVLGPLGGVNWDGRGVAGFARSVVGSAGINVFQGKMLDQLKPESKP
jgi:hypothetical protein